MATQPTSSAARIGASFAALLLAAVASGPAGAQSNPLTEAPGERGPVREVPAAPQGVDEERAAANPAATEIIRSLAPFADGNPNAPRRYRDIDADGGKVRVDYARAVDLTVFFAYDSARLTPEARVQLEPLGRALQSEKLANRRFLIAGHTDAAGGDAYNRRLSLRRAIEVRAFLVAAYGIDPDRLVVYGWGRSRPKTPENPYARINRRVEVALIEPRRSSRYEDDGRVSGAEGCGLAELRDPRLRRPLDLDDFAAPPAAVCAAALDMDDLVYERRR